MLTATSLQPVYMLPGCFAHLSLKSRLHRMGSGVRLTRNFPRYAHPARVEGRSIWPGSHMPMVASLIFPWKGLSHATNCKSPMARRTATHGKSVDPFRPLAFRLTTIVWQPIYQFGHDIRGDVHLTTRLQELHQHHGASPLLTCWSNASRWRETWCRRTLQDHPKRHKHLS
jgi:hypothetical protein